MAKIVIRGSSQSILKEEAKEAISFFADYLLGRRLGKNVYIYVTFNQNLFKKEQNYGYVMPIDVAARFPRKFSIKIDAQLNNRRTLIALAHEMVHVKQYVRGELKDMVSPVRKWLGKAFSDDYDYDLQPWEIQARKMESLLYRVMDRL